ncbi:MAG TPA: TetR/AcrR family transcriptional regulator [Candidatus Binataceae bacterium]|nr:TetR/AcrR family transcriptional regulator [Candidatus Binataceae bacterium]
MRKPGSRGPETLRNLRAAAIELLAERSYEGMNLRLLASKLRLQAGSLYNYIESKPQLLFWLMKDSTEKLLHEFDDTIAGIAEPAQQMRKFVAFHVGYHIVNRKEATVLMTEMRSLTPRNYRAVKQLQRLYTDKVHAIVERGVAAGEFIVEDSRVTTFVLLQMLTSVARWYDPRGRLSVDELVGVYTDLAFAMLRARRSDSAAPRVTGVTANRAKVQVNGDPITHSFDLGGHLLQISITPPPKTRHSTNGAAKPSNRPSVRG